MSNTVDVSKICQTSEKTIKTRQMIIRGLLVIMCLKFKLSEFTWGHKNGKVDDKCFLLSEMTSFMEIYGIWVKFQPVKASLLIVLLKIFPLLQANSLPVMFAVKGASAWTNINLTLLPLNIQLIWILKKPKGSSIKYVITEIVQSFLSCQAYPIHILKDFIIS